jgi:hypothetical protein
MGSVDAESHRSALEALLKREALRPVDLLIEASVAEWVKSHGGADPSDPVAMAVTDDETGRWGIVLRRNIEESAIGNVLDRIEFVGGFTQCRALLDTPEKFLKHTILHELAHLANSWGQERENDCDGWAFERLGNAT